MRPFPEVKMSRITRGEVEADMKEEQMKRQLQEAADRAAGVVKPPPPPEPKGFLAWVLIILGVACLVGFFLGFYFLAMSFLL
jgi:hypothetical protein